jgi:hypothetical protein
VVTCWQISRTYADISTRRKGWWGATYESLERRLEEQQISRLLVAADLAQCDSAWLVALLGTIRRRSYRTNCSGCQSMGGLRNRFQVSARRLPESLRAPVLALPPREPVLALPPREGRALSRLVGVLGAISLRLRSDCVDGGDDSGRTAGVCGRVRVLSRRVERTKSRDSCKARLYGVIAVQQAVLQTTAAVQEYRRDSERRVQERMRVNGIVCRVDGDCRTVHEGLGNVAGTCKSRVDEIRLDFGLGVASDKLRSQKEQHITRPLPQLGGHM